eukprot:Em0006g324a
MYGVDGIFSHCCETVHYFSCTDPCSYWVLYLLDSSMPLGGRCSSLPCTLDTTSILKDAVTVYNSLSLVSRNRMTISTNGTLSMVAQCAYLASYKDPLVIRQGVMLRSTSSSQPVDCSTPQPSTVPRPSVTTSSPLLVTDSVNLTDDASSQTKLNPGKQKYKPCGKIKDDIGLGACSAPQEGRSKCDLNLKPGVTGTASNTDSRYCEIEAIIDHYMNDEVRMEETGDIEAESGGVDPDVAEDHDEFDLGDMWCLTHAGYRRYKVRYPVGFKSATSSGED